MLCPVGNNTKERVMDTFIANNLVAPYPRTDGSWFVLKQEEFDRENQRLSAQMLQDHNILNSFWTREGNTARFSDTFAQLVDYVGGIPEAQPITEERYGPDMSPAEEAFVKSAEFKAWAGGNAIKDDNGVPILLFHGTTHRFDITEADISKSNPDNYFGSGIYFTTDHIDAETNYAGIGADLENRIALLAENISSYTEIPYEEAKVQATEILYGKDENIIRAFVKAEKPYDLTTLRYDSLYSENEDGDYVEHEDSLPFKLYEAIQEVASDTGYFDGGAVWGEIAEHFEDFDGVRASDIDQQLRNAEALMYAEDEDGKLVSHEMIGRIYLSMGYDAVIMDADAAFGSGAKGKKMKMSRNTKHIIIFDPAQAISSTGKITEIRNSPGLPDILVKKDWESPC